MSAISIRNLTKSFSTKLVINNLNLIIDPNEIVLLVGKNGSGKSTLLRILSGLSNKNGGDIQIDKDKIGYTHHQSMMYSPLTVKENIYFFQKILKCTLDLDSYLESWNLTPHKEQILRSLSQGQKALTSLARAFLNSPNILLLDEPTSYLDNSKVELLVNKINNTTCLIASHDIERLRRVATRIIVLDDGKIGCDSKMSSLDETIEYYHRCNH